MFNFLKLNFRIWEEFANMVANKDKTIIITTHYIEEATKANCVSFVLNFRFSLYEVRIVLQK